MPKMVNNSLVNAPFYQEKRKTGQRFNNNNGAANEAANLDGSSNNNSGTNVADATAAAAGAAVDNYEHLRKIFVGGLSISTTADMMRLFFSQFGEVADAVVMRDPISNRSRGFGFVTYVEPEAVENVQRARPHIIDCKTVDTKRAFPRHEFNRAVGHLSNIKTNKIFLGGLKDCHNEDVLCEYFGQFGSVTSVKVLLDKETGRKRGFGFLEFKDTASAARALAQGKHTINLITIEVKKSTQVPDCSKRIRLPIGGAASAGYAPPQPTIMDNFVYNANYNPYQAQTSLPPSAFFNGWASYVAPTMPAPYARYPHHYPHQQQYHHHQPSMPAGGGWNYGHSDWPRNGYNPVAWPMKGGPKAANHLSSAGTTERPKNEYKSVQAQEATKQQITEKLQAESSVDVEKKWLAKDYKVFKPSGRYNLNTPHSNLSSNDATPAYGI